MISVEQALELVRQHAEPRATRQVTLADALGMVLAEDVVSDVDSPPHDKALMDGYALCSDDVAAGVRELAVLEEVTAGQVPRLAVRRGSATRIMTGAPLPEGADAVVMVERTERIEPADGPARVRINELTVHAGQNIMRRATSLSKGQRVLAPGHRLRPIEIGLLAEVGRAQVRVAGRPTVGVLATGNELVEPGQRPADGQIRNSNGPMLSASVEFVGGQALDLGIARDTAEDLARKIAGGLQHDVLLLSGGVSAGVLDLVPGTLQQLGVREVFHKVNLKPGKPLWFGVNPNRQPASLVFGLPGNPVSSLVCFQMFVRTALARMAGCNDPPWVQTKARLLSRHRQRGDRPTYLPARLCQRDDDLVVEPLEWRGSADLRTLVDANALIEFPAGDHDFEAGQPITAYWL
jgi:molybdopterin molybdotransferase